MSSRFSGVAGDKPTVPEEFDSYVREAKVWLHDSEASGLGNRFIFRHWMLVFEFVDKSVRAIEGVNYYGILLPSFTKMKYPGSRQVSRKATIKISPTRIRELVLNNPYNGKEYDPLVYNCQTWLNWILKELELDEEITAGSEVAWTTISVGLGLINPVIGFGTYAARQTYSFIYNLVKR